MFYFKFFTNEMIMRQMPPPLRTTCRLLSALCLIGIPTILLLPAVVWISPTAVVALFDALPPELPSDLEALGAVPTLNRIGSYLALAVPAAVLCAGLWRLRTMFRCFGRGEVFSEAPISSLRFFAVTLLLHTILQPIAGAAASVFATYHLGPGQRALTISIGSGELISLALSGLLLVLSWVLLEAVRIDKENREFI